MINNTMNTTKNKICQYQHAQCVASEDRGGKISTA